MTLHATVREFVKAKAPQKVIEFRAGPGTGGSMESTNTNGPRRRVNNPRLPSECRDTLIRAIAQKGDGKVAEDLRSLSPDKSPLACSSMLNTMERDSNHRYHSTTIRLLGRLAAMYQNGGQAVMPAPASARVQSVQPIATPPVQVPSTQFIQAAAKAAAAIVRQEFQDRPPAQLPASRSARRRGQRERQAELIACGEYEPRAERKPLTFESLDRASQIATLWSMAGRYAKQLEALGIDQDRTLGLAWHRAYAAYSNEVVVDVEDLATEENEHRTGRSRVKPLDIIERRGDLVRFYNIAKKAWE